MLLSVMLLLTLIASRLPTSRPQRNLADESITEWVNFLRWLQPGVTSFTLSFGDSLSLDCRGTSHVKKVRLPLALEWRLHDRALTDEGPTGRVSLMDDDGRLTVENVNERDGGLYAAYAETRSLARLLDLSLATGPNDTRVQLGDRFLGSRLALCLFVVRVETLRVFSLREGDPFEVNASSWLAPVADTLDALGMAQEEWSLAWYHQDETSVPCRRIAVCHLALNGSHEVGNGGWSLELRSLVDTKSQRRVLMEFSVTVLPALSYLESFPLETHQYYMVSGTLMIALFLLSLHLFNNLNWTPFAFDVLPDQVSPKAVLDQAGVFLKDSRV
ncbi:hypothetical protein BOX15_Mlig028035g2 [Macrostomum lignano]|uniref:Ig-like domain-containing protein n=1 Tax=Macrostomum lignano TaxID=282301 RepID=A0A267DQ58_9PLAT|nr:hypothetical protein BOX15_Mlig028035g1 [Macrostomum lignano]PAA84024.1 hypothetical protein BOX15_Mlig028035g2 [Macrostomum lignano]